MVSSNTTKDTLFNAIMKNLVDVNKETFEKAQISHYFVVIHHNVYQDLIQPFYLENKDNIEDSLFKFRFIELGKQLQWLYFNIMSGSYYPSIIEIRYIYEAFIQSYYLDKKYPDAKIEKKLEILKKEDLYGSRLIKNTSELNNYKKELNKLYFKLSKYVHSSYEKMNPVFQNEEFELVIKFEYNERMLLECINLLHSTIDAILLSIFLYDTELSSKISDKFIETLNKNKYELTYELIKSKRE